VNQFIRNLGGDERGLARRAWLLVRNLSLRPLRGQACCGHPGEPGC
jgi:hypothetical protein